MSKKGKKKESWKEKRRRAALKRERALKAERIKREREREKKPRGWPRGKVLAVVFLIFLVPMAYGVWQYTQPSSSPSSEPSSPPSGNKAPPFTLTDINGNTVSLDQFVGKVVVLNFFDTYCTYCIPEISELAKVYEEYRNDPIVIISIDVDPHHDTVPILQQFREAHQISWIIAQDSAGVFEKYITGPQLGTPTTIIINQEGYISPHGPFIGLHPASTLSDEIDLLLGR